MKELCLLVAMILAMSTHRAFAQDGPNATALIRNPSSIVLDGRLDEPEWQDAPVLRLVQQSPKPGVATPYETEVRIIVSGDRIFFGFDCKDPHPNRLSIHTMRRDETMGQDGQTLTDDTVSIVLDTYGDSCGGRPKPIQLTCALAVAPVRLLTSPPPDFLR